MMKYIQSLNELDKELLNVADFEQFKKSNRYPRFYAYSIGNNNVLPPDFGDAKLTTLKNIKSHITNKMGHIQSRIYLLNPHKENDDFDVVLVSIRNEFDKKWQDVFELTGTVKLVKTN